MAKPEIVPLEPVELERRREELRRCAVSRGKRIDWTARFRSWYESGSDTGTAANYNKLFSHINRVSSFIFSPGTVRFGVHLPPSVREYWLRPATIARDEFRQIWDAAQSDLKCLMALQWSLVYGSDLLKIQADPTQGFQLGFIQPWDFGVSREDMSELDEQDTFAHWYTLSLPQVERWVYDDPHEQTILEVARKHMRTTKTYATRNRLVLSSVTGTFPGGTIAGGFPGEPSTEATMQAEVEEPTVEFVDLWQRRPFRRHRGKQNEEVFLDYLVTTFIAGENIPVAQRRNPDFPDTPISMSVSLPSESPFVVMRPHPIPDYFWGRSELDNLTNLQDWMDEYISDLKSSIRKELNPPKFFSGIPDFEEAGRALDTPGGQYGAPDPGAKMDKLAVQLTPQVLSVWHMINDLFAEVSGIPGSLAEPAQMPGGIRATGHFSMAAGIGAGRLRQMALVVEDVLGTLATKAFHLLQRNSREVFKTDDGKTFLLGQIPPSITLSVNAHSAAPIFAEQTQAKAMMLIKSGAITPEDFVELLDPPNREELKEKAKELAKHKAELTGKMLEIQEEKATKGLKGTGHKK